MSAGTVQQVVVQSCVECTNSGSVAAFNEVVAANSKYHVFQTEPVSCRVYCAMLSGRLIRCGLNSCSGQLIKCQRIL